MTNIQTKTKGKDMRLHIDKAYGIIDNNLPDNYVNSVKSKLIGQNVTSGIIRNIRNRKTEYPMNHIHVVNALVQVANEYQNELAKLETLTP